MQLTHVHNSYTDVELKAEEGERKIARLEKELDEQETKYEELLEKYNNSKSELEDLARQFDELQTFISLTCSLLNGSKIQ